MNRDELAPYLAHPFSLLHEGFLEQFASLDHEEFSCLWTKVAIEPVEYSSAFEKTTYELNGYVQWHGVLTHLGCHPGARVAEIGPGASVILPVAISLATQGDAEYTAVDPDAKRLLELEKRLSNLPISKRFIASAAGDLPQQVPPCSFDYVVGHHIINDLIETIVASQQGPATGSSLNERYSAVRLVSKLYRRGNLWNIVEKDLKKQLGGCWHSLEEGGLLVWNHFTFKLDVEWGYPLELYSSLTHFFRRRFLVEEHWEILEAGLDPDKWLVARKPRCSISNRNTQ